MEDYEETQGFVPEGQRTISITDINLLGRRGWIMRRLPVCVRAGDIDAPKVTSEECVGGVGGWLESAGMSFAPSY